MNLANKLTLFRVVLIPFFVTFMLTDFTEYNYVIALIIFIIATITDKLDGTIARRCNMSTVFGEFMDPIADKLLVSSALICLCDIGKLPSWVVITIIAREFIISGIRLISAQQGVAIAASWWGKIKTIAQMAMIIIMLVDMSVSFMSFEILGIIMMYVSLFLTVVSAIDYIYKNRSLLKGGK